MNDMRQEILSQLNIKLTAKISGLVQLDKALDKALNKAFDKKDKTTHKSLGILEKKIKDYID